MVFYKVYKWYIIKWCHIRYFIRYSRGYSVAYSTRYRIRYSVGYFSEVFCRVFYSLFESLAIYATFLRNSWIHIPDFFHINPYLGSYNSIGILRSWACSDFHYIEPRYYRVPIGFRSQ